MVWVIAFKDGDDLYYWRTENFNDVDEFINYGSVKTFETEEECEKFMYDYTDSRNFDFYPAEISQKEVDDYNSSEKGEC